MFKNTSVLCMYGVTPCHAGSGSALGVVDLPIQRERHTEWPLIQASGMKGALRANFDYFKDNIADKTKIKEFNDLTESIFGSSSSNGYAGSLSVSDARILAYPMRSDCAPFVWITCPAVLQRLLRDLKSAGKIKEENEIIIPTIKNEKAIIYGGINSDKVLVEDYEVDIIEDTTVGKSLKPLLTYFLKCDRLLIVSDEVFKYGVTECTQINAQISIDSETGTTKDGSLRYQEELPSDTLMYSILHWGKSRNKDEPELAAELIQKFITTEVIATHIQVGGDETLGRGIFEIEWK